MILSNPAALTIFVLQCDLFSQAEIVASDKLKEKLQQPNPFQDQTAFLWDFMFWNMLGNAYLNSESKILKEDNYVYWLNMANIRIKNEILKKAERHIFSKKALEELMNNNIQYRYSDGMERKIPLSDLVILTDLTHGATNWLIGPSRVDALYKIISNSDSALNAKAKNLEFVQKFIVSGQISEDNVNEFVMGDEEVKDIREKVKGEEDIFPVKTPVDIKRFVENIVRLGLDDAYWNDCYKIGKMFNIPKDVIEAFVGKGSTYENQEKGRASHVEYSLKAKGDNMIKKIAIFYGEDPKECELTWDHKSFNQVFENERAKTNDVRGKALKVFVEMGADRNEAAKYLGIKNLNFTEPEPIEPIIEE